jgi:hypothetical protein
LPSILFGVFEKLPVRGRGGRRRSTSERPRSPSRAEPPPHLFLAPSVQESALRGQPSVGSAGPGPKIGWPACDV